MIAENAISIKYTVRYLDSQAPSYTVSNAFFFFFSKELRNCGKVEVAVLIGSNNPYGLCMWT